MRIENGRVKNEQIHFRFKRKRSAEAGAPETVLFSVSLQSMLSIAFHLSLLFVIFFCPAYVLFFPNAVDAIYFKATLALGTLAVLVVASIRPRPFETEAGYARCSLCAGVCTPFCCVPVAASLIPQTPAVFEALAAIALASAAVAGIGMGCLMLATLRNLFSLRWEQNAFISIVASGIAAVVYLIMSSLSTVAFLVMILLFAPASLLCSKTGLSGHETEGAAAPQDAEAYAKDAPATKERTRERYFFKRNALAFSYATCAGFFAGSISSFLEFSGIMTAVVGVGLVAISALMLWGLTKTARHPGLGYDRLFFPCSAALIMLLLFLPDSLRAVDLALLFLLTPAGDIFDMASKGLATSDTSYIRDGAMARALSIVGTVAGLVVSFALFVTYDDGNLHVLIIVVLVLMLIFAMSVSMLIPDEEAQFEAFLARNDPATEGTEETPSAAEAQPTRDVLDDAVHAMAQRYRLTAREEEIMGYLVRGRNAQYLEKKLVVSNSTVKSHMHNLYRKLGVHSQQQLIDLVEEFGH